MIMKGIFLLLAVKSIDKKTEIKLSKANNKYR
jgi:hypothetical protein